MINIGELQRVYEEWNKALPRVHPFYAMKSNDDPVILKVFATLGTGFDCASMVIYLSLTTFTAFIKRIIIMW